jgi:UDPglucose 6-dehydrogenase
VEISVVGTGYVGLVAGACFAEKGHSVTCVDIDARKIALMESGVSPIYEAGLEELMRRNQDAGRLRYTTDGKSAYRAADAIFIGVGTPERPDGSADLSHIAAAARRIAESLEKECLVVVKSTVPVGTNDKVERLIRDFLARDVHVEVASNPEFLSQGSAVHDTLHAQRVVIGAETGWAREILRKIYAPFGLPMVFASRRSAEMIKYASNDFLALKISYMNDIANLCELVGADVQDVALGMGHDPRIGKSFLNAGVGYGGSCFPKDTKALRFLARQHGYELKTVEAAVEVNSAQKTRLIKKAEGRLITFSGLRAAILGVAFKPGTDDLREAPAVENARILIERGADVIAYDPAGAEGLKRLLPSAARAGTPEEALSGASICFVFTEWSEIRAVKPADFKRLMRIPLVYDGRNIYDIQEMRDAGVEYYSIGRQPKEGGGPGS